MVLQIGVQLVGACEVGLGGWAGILGWVVVPWRLGCVVGPWWLVPWCGGNQHVGLSSLEDNVEGTASSR